ncbi:MAG: integrase [bacterium]|nr:integrase [bacterium]
MRQQSLRQTANRYLQTDNRGSFKDKKHRAFVIHKLIDDLFLIGEVPASWNALTRNHIKKLIQLWRKKKVKPATIMDHMTTIRRFLINIECPLPDIDNKSLGLVRQYKSHKLKSIQTNIWISIQEPIARLILALQTQFGLTFNEAINLNPDIHIKEDKLWITREIAFNSEDRTIPLRNTIQTVVVSELINYTKGKQSLVKMHHYSHIRTQWHETLSPHQLPTNKTYRYLYAQHLKKELVPILGNYQTDWLIRDEMGIKSRNTLWTYLHE